MYKITIGKNEYQVSTGEEGLRVNEHLIDWDLVRVSGNHFHIIYQNKGYKVEVIKADAETKTVQLKLGGKTFTLNVKDRFDLLLEKMGMTAAASGKINSIKAPMPGLIIDLKVKSGDSVKSGDPLLILEAMKMENIIKSPGEGTIKSVSVKKGESVEKNQVLIEF